MTVAPEGYPATWEADVVLSDGGTVRVRPIRPDDGDRIRQFHARQSPESIYFRFFSPRPELSDADVEHFTNVDYVDRMALVAERDGQLVGIARYDRWQTRREAEVAFFVDDAHHGRGMATVLLEHLAARAREVGITRFTASVLPDNRRMLGVFTQAGFSVASRYSDGVVEVNLDLQPTTDAELAIEARAQRAAAVAVERLLSPRSIAVIGASRRPGTLGHEVFRHLLGAGFEGPVWPVNALARHVSGVRAVASIADIDEPIDVAVIVVPAASVPAALEECGRKGVYGAIVLSAGFAEQGGEGAALEAEALRIVRRFGMRMLGPASLGMVNTAPDVRVHATFARLDALPGRFALLSESGMVGAAIVDQASALQLGISSFVALGNRADVSGNDLLQYWETDERTDVVGMYIESFGNPRRFSRIARRVARAKPVVAVRAGLGTSRGAEMPADVLLEQTGVIGVRTLSQLLDVTRLLVHQPVPPGRRVAIVGNPGGSQALVADACVEAGLVLAEPGPAARWVLDEVAAPSARPSANPVDLGLEAGAEHFARAVEALLADPGVDSVLVVYSPGLGARHDEVIDAVAAVAAVDRTKPLAACVFGRHPIELGVTPEVVLPVYGAVDSAALALGRAAAYGRWRARPEGELVRLDDEVVAAAQAEVARRLAAAGGRRVRLDLVAAQPLLDAVGIRSARTVVVGDPGAAVVAGNEIGWPVALKAAGRDKLAKTVAAGVALDLHGGSALDWSWALMAERLGSRVAPAVVQEMVDPGVDVGIVIAPNDIVGPVLSVRAGGAAGVLDPTSGIQVLPVTDLDARRLVDGSHLAAVLDEPARVCLQELLVRVSALVEQVPEVEVVELDPIVVGADGAVVVDARVQLTERARDPQPSVRRL
ncbi:MAG: GNAT family N-acetyltransferase [Acidimicrobiia bacterium]